MADQQSLQTFTQLWQQLAEDKAERMLFRIPTQQTGQVLSFRVKAFVKRAAKVANAFLITLKLKPGDRIALLTQSPEDYALLLHGSWLAHVVPVVLSMEMSDQKLVAALQQTNTSAVVFPPESSARIASLFGKVPGVKHWITSGKASFGGSGVAHKLEELVQRAEFTLPDISQGAKEVDGLIVPSTGTVAQPNFVLFTQRALISAGEAAASLYSSAAPEDSVYWCGLPLESFDGLLHNCLAPLFSQLAAYVTSDVNLRQFWEFAYADALCAAVVSQEQLRVINRRGKPRAWLKPEGFQIVVYSSEPLLPSMVSTFQERFLTPLFPCYSILEAGGVVTAFPREVTDEYRQEWLTDFDVPSSGVALPGVEFDIRSPGGELLGDEFLGKIQVKSPRCVVGYVGTSNGETRLISPTLVETGDEGYRATDEQGREHLFVHGRCSDFIQRGDNRVSPSRANAVLAEIRGIDYARTLGFPNVARGYELGAYVIPVRAANLTEEAILAMLRVNLEWDECPKVIVFGRRNEDGSLPLRAEIDALFEPYFDVDYDFGRV